ncbi:Rha family transcriptional regulator [Comamonas thiooxydans]|uniref:Rha family transcriptional regulator n=1 Tax=Comamonas thiooxydans TaxID=363952 RepID=UPI0038D43BC5
MTGLHVPAEFAGSTGRTLPDYRIARDGLALLATGLTGKKALAFKLACMDAFHRMEAMRTRRPTPGAWG